MRECPCKHCNKRTPTCHGSCEDYREWSKENEKMRAKTRQSITTYYLSINDRGNRRRRK